MEESFSIYKGPIAQMEAPDDSLIETLQTSKRPPRREIIWNDFGFSESSLSCICQSYDEVIFDLDDTVQLPRRVGHEIISYYYRRACKCEGYIREEITLTPDAFQNAVLIYQQPAPNERCGVCKELLWKDFEQNPSINQKNNSASDLHKLYVLFSTYKTNNFLITILAKLCVLILALFALKSWEV